MHGAVLSGAVVGPAAGAAAVDVEEVAQAAAGAAAGAVAGAVVQVDIAAAAAEDKVDQHREVMCTTGVEDDECW